MLKKFIKSIYSIGTTRRLSRTMRWALLGLTFSILSNSIFTGGVIPAILLVGLPAWAVAFNNTFGVFSDFLSPIGAWVVDRLGSFAALAGAEFVEGILCLIVALTPSTLGMWKWMLLALSCLLLVTGQIIDISSEIFEVEIADNEHMLIEYNGYASVVMSVFGTLLGNVLGSFIATKSLFVLLMLSAVLSFSCTITRIFSQKDVRKTQQVSELGDSDSEDTERTNVLKSNRETKTKLLLATFLLTLTPSLFNAYTTMGYAHEVKINAITVIYGVVGVCTVIGSLVYMRLIKRMNLRSVGVWGSAIIAFGMIALSIPNFWAALVGWGLESFGFVLAGHAIITSRQLIIEREYLPKFTGWVRLASAIAAAGGSWVSWWIYTYASWHVLPLISLVPAIALVAICALTLYKNRLTE
ncbi:MFS transporter [Alloscardovia venturai]|uniref:MFS transporter n=2 Tax=Alloscardovia venturai TaxID=1769421 RepID=A0ABW2Y4T4_9BIFI